MTLAVVIPVYNVKDYLQEAVDSVLNQTPPPAEVILVDDGSTDGSGELVDQLYSAVSNVKILHTENRGLGFARNLGFAHAESEFIAFLDSDDIAEPGLVATLDDVVRRYPLVDLIGYAATPFRDGPSPTGSKNSDIKDRWARPWDRVFSTGREALNQLVEERAYITNAWVHAVRRTLLINDGLYFRPIYYEDAEFTPRLFAKAGLTAIVPVRLVAYRLRAGSIMRSPVVRKSLVGRLAVIRSLTVLIGANSGDPRTRKNLMQLRRKNVFELLRIWKESAKNSRNGLQSRYWSSFIHLIWERPLVLLSIVSPRLYKRVSRNAPWRNRVYE